MYKECKFYVLQKLESELSEHKKLVQSLSASSVKPHQGEVTLLPRSDDVQAKWEALSREAAQKKQALAELIEATKPSVINF